MFFFGTGTGIVPYRSMLEQIAKEEMIEEAVIVQGASTKRDCIYQADFRAYALRYPKIRYYACISDGSGTEDFEYTGRVQACLSDLDFSSATVYLCGNPYMISDMTDYLQQTSNAKIVTESYYKKPIPLL